MVAQLHNFQASGKCHFYKPSVGIFLFVRFQGYLIGCLYQECYCTTKIEIKRVNQCHYVVFT